MLSLYKTMLKNMYGLTESESIPHYSSMYNTRHTLIMYVHCVGLRYGKEYPNQNLVDELTASVGNHFNMEVCRKLNINEICRLYILLNNPTHELSVLYSFVNNFYISEV